MDKSKGVMAYDVQSVGEGSVSTPSLSDPVGRAINDFLSGLTENHKEDSKNPFLNELMRIERSQRNGNARLRGVNYAQESIYNLQDCMEKLEVKRQSRRGNRIIHKMTPFLEGFKSMMKLCEPLGQAGPLGTGVAISGARIVLELAIGFDQYFEDLVDALHAIGDYIKVYELHGETFKDVPGFQDRLVRSYTRIFEFWYKASKRLCKTGPTVFKLLGPLYQEMKDTVESLKEDSMHIQSLAMANHFRQWNQDRGSHVRECVRQWIVGDRAGEIDVREDLERKRRYRQPGTCTWMFEDPRFKEWRDSKEKSVLWYNAPPGSGKTVLASAIIDHLQEKGEKVAYFFFSFNDNLRKHGINGFKSLILQMLHLFSNKLSDRFEKLCREEMSRMGGLGNNSVATEMIHELVKTNDVCIVVDGLDECVDVDVPEEEESGEYKPDMLRYLEEMIKRATYGRERWLFTSRNRHSKIYETMRRVDAKEITADSSTVMKDIQTYLSANMPCNHLVTKYAESEDNFLYARILCRTFGGKRITRQSDIETELQVFPKDLNGYFTRSLEKISEHTEYKQELVRRLFLLLATSKQSLTFDEVIDALSIIPEAKDHSYKNVPIEGRALIENLCGPLVEFDNRGNNSEDNPIVKFCHKSIQDYLRQNPAKDDSIRKDCYKFFLHNRKAAKVELGMNCVTYLTYKRYMQYQDIDSLLQDTPKEHAFLRYAATFWCQHLFSIKPSSEICDRVINFLGSKAFWNCLCVQSRVAPFLFGFYSHRKAGSFRMDVRGSESLGEDSFGVPLPGWLGEYSKDLDYSFCSFVSEWREVLVTCPWGLNYCLPLRESPKGNTCYLKPLTQTKTSRILRVANLEEAISLDQIAKVYVFDLYFQGRKPVVDLLFRGKYDPVNEIQQIQTPVLREKTPREIGISQRTHKTCPAEDKENRIYIIGRGVSRDTLEEWQINWQTLKLRRISRPSDQASNLTLASHRDQHKKSEYGWKLLRTNTVLNNSGSTAHLLYLARKEAKNTTFMNSTAKDREDDADSDSDSTASQSTSDADSFSDDYGSEDDSESHDELLNEEASKTSSGERKQVIAQDENTDCLIVVSQDSPPIIVKWITRSSYWANATAAMHPTLSLIALTHSPIQLELIDLETGARKNVNLPELADVTETPAAYSRELKFSSCGNYLHLLLLSFFRHGHQGSHTECVVKVSTFRFNSGSDRNSDVLMREFQAQSCTFISAAHLGQMRAPLALTDWVDGCLFVALPPLTCDPKILKIILPTKEPVAVATEAAAACCEESKGIFILREQIYFPTSTPRRNPSLKYRPMANGLGGIYLALGALLPELNKDESEKVKLSEASDQKPLQASPPVVLRWKISDESGWRTWDVNADQKSSEAMEYRSIVAKLRGSFIDSEKSFTVPTRCGLNWDRKGYLSCG